MAGKIPNAQPCPTCGAEPVRAKVGPRRWYIGCRAGGDKCLPGLLATTDAQALKAWNEEVRSYDPARKRH